MRIWMSLLLLVLGVFAMVSGEVDDSPGLQGLGLILIISVAFFAYRRSKTK
jgi:hypothetical protein